MQNRRKSRNLFPEPKFQLRMIALLVGGCALQIAATNFILFYFLRRNYALFAKYAQFDTEVSRLLSHEFHFIILLISATFVLFLAGVTVIGIFFSHRVAGPLYAIRRTVRDTLEGKKVDLQFRTGDEFMPIADDFNELLRNYHGRGAGASKAVQ